MATQKKTKNVSYRKNRDYTSSFTWTYELNQDVYHCYTKAKENPAVGYTKRLKKLWDEKHPELDTFNEKQLSLQAKRYEKKIVFDVVPEGRDQQTAQETVTSSNAPANDDEILDVPCESDVNVDVENEVVNIDNELFEKMKCKFLQYFDVYKDRSLAQRNYKTQVCYQIGDDEWDAINGVISTFINENPRNTDLWHLNVIQYCAIVTLLDIRGVLKERKHYARETRTPTWKKVLEEQINNTRRKISLNHCNHLRRLLRRLCMVNLRF